MHLAVEEDPVVRIENLFGTGYETRLGVGSAAEYFATVLVLGSLDDEARECGC